MTDRLKPCPFCGGEASIKISYITQEGVVVGKYKSLCNECQCTKEGFDTKREAIKAWNIRKPMDRIVEQLEERTKFLKDCTKYGNKDAEQQNHSYSTMFMYEVADMVDDLIEIVKEEGK